MGRINQDQGLHGGVGSVARCLGVGNLHEDPTIGLSKRAAVSYESLTDG